MRSTWSHETCCHLTCGQGTSRAGGPAVTLGDEIEVAGLESDLGQRLPSDYRDFLLSTDQTSGEVTDASGATYDVLGFYGTPGSSGTQELDPGEGVTEDDGLLAVAETDEPATLYLDLATGAVWREDQEGERLTGTGQKLVLAADSFADLLERFES